MRRFRHADGKRRRAELGVEKCCLGSTWDRGVTSIGCEPADHIQTLTLDLHGPAHARPHRGPIVEGSDQVPLYRTQGLPRCPIANDRDLVARPTLGMGAAELTTHWRWTTERGP
jgi:hypothetical protein